MCVQFTPKALKDSHAVLLGLDYLLRDHRGLPHSPDYRQFEQWEEIINCRSCRSKIVYLPFEELVSIFCPFCGHKHKLSRR